MDNKLIPNNNLRDKALAAQSVINEYLLTMVDTISAATNKNTEATNENTKAIKSLGNKQDRTTEVIIDTKNELTDKIGHVEKKVSDAFDGKRDDEITNKEIAKKTNLCSKSCKFHKLFVGALITNVISKKYPLGTITWRAAANNAHGTYYYSPSELVLQKVTEWTETELPKFPTIPVLIEGEKRMCYKIQFEEGDIEYMVYRHSFISSLSDNMQI